MNLNEGPTNITVPAIVQTVCHGCKYLKSKPMMRGRFVHTNTYACSNEEANKMEGRDFRLGDERVIAFNIEGNCSTPSWCPFLMKKG